MFVVLFLSVDSPGWGSWWRSWGSSGIPQESCWSKHVGGK